MVPMVMVLPPAAICAGRAEVLRGGGRAEAGVGAVPQRDVVRAQDAVDGVGEVLRLQIGELALLLAELHVEEVVVDLRDQRLQRNAALDAGGRDERRDDVARVDEAALDAAGAGMAVSSK